MFSHVSDGSLDYLLKKVLGSLEKEHELVFSTVGPSLGGETGRPPQADYAQKLEVGRFGLHGPSIYPPLGFGFDETTR